MEAFSDKSIKAIITNIGGEDSIGILSFVDIEVIKNNPKIFLGFSDDTITHFLCYKAGLTSFYGTSVMVCFAENGGMHQCQINDIYKTLFSTDVIGRIVSNTEGWTSEFMEWGDIALQNTQRGLLKNNGWNFLQAKGKIKED